MENTGDAVKWVDKYFQQETNYDITPTDGVLYAILDMAHSRIDWERLGVRLYEDFHGSPEVDDTAIPIN